MSNDPATTMPIPADYAEYVRDWAEHVVATGHANTVRYWEIGNEAWQFYGTSSPDATKLHNYIALYQAAQAVLESVTPGSYVGNDGMTYMSTISEFASHSANVTLLDFHKYDTGSTSSTDSYIFGRAERYMVTTGSYYYSPSDAKTYWTSHGGAANAIVIDSECQLNYAWSPTDDRIQYIQGAVWNSLVLRHEALTGKINYHVYFDEYASSSPSGFGYISFSPTKLYYGYYPYYWLGNYLESGDTFRSITSSSVNMRTMAWNDSSGNAYVLLIHNSTSLDTVSVTGTGLNVSELVSVYKIDNTYPWDNALVQSSTVNATSMSVAFNGLGVAILAGVLPGGSGSTPSGEGDYNFYGGLSEGDNSHTGPVVVTLYETSGNFQNLTVDSAIGAEPSGINMSNLDYYTWSIGSGMTRRYVVGAGETTFYVYLPDTTFSVYNFHILDYAGTFWTGVSYLRTIKVLGGVERTIEQVRTTANPLSYDIPVSLVTGRTYIIELEDSMGTTYRYEFFAGATATINLYVNPAVFSDQVRTAYKYVR
jgi:hypothetical protein